jgi:hypothetical protein
LQFNNNPFALGEWFLFSVALVLVVTLVYLLVLHRSPPPEGLTMSKLEESNSLQTRAGALQPLAQAESFLAANNINGAVQSSVITVSVALKSLLGSQVGTEGDTLGISDAAYLVQSKAASAPQIVQSVYQLNNLNLQTLRGQPVSQAEAAWAVSFAKWLVQAIESNQIKL